MKLLNRTTLFKQVVSVAGIASVSSLLSLPGLAQMNPHSFNQSLQSSELAQGSSGGGSAGGGSSTGGSSNSPSNSSSPGGSSTPSNRSGGSSNSPSNGSSPGGSSTPSNQSGDNDSDRTNSPSNNSGGATSPNREGAENSLSSQDRTFINQAAQMGMLEVQLGQMAMQRGSSNTVKQYGQRMVNEHTQANRQLMQLAAQKGVTPSTELNNEYKTRMQRLSQLSGAEFDEAYMREMVTSHNQAIALFQTQAQRGQDSDLKAWASQLVPNLQAHLQMANQVAQETKTR